MCPYFRGMLTRFQNTANNFWTHLRMMMEEARSKELKYARVAAGEPPEKQKKIAQRDAIIRRIVERYAEYDRLEYLRAIAHRFSL